MANTTNFNWETPDDTDLVKDGALAIRTLGSAIDTSLVDLKGGTTGQYLSKASNTDMDFSWGTVSAPANEALGYKWDMWNPSNNSGTITNASTGSSSGNTTNISVSNSSGTLTATFASTGFYLVNLFMFTINANIYDYEAGYFALGGTATRYTGGTATEFSSWGESDIDGDVNMGIGFLVNATAANQTLTILPKGRVSSGQAATDFDFYASAAIVRM